MILEIIFVKTIGITIDPTIDIITVKTKNTTQILAHIEVSLEAAEKVC